MDPVVGGRGFENFKKEEIRIDRSIEHGAWCERTSELDSCGLWHIVLSWVDRYGVDATSVTVVPRWLGVWSMVNNGGGGGGGATGRECSMASGVSRADCPEAHCSGSTICMGLTVLRLFDRILRWWWWCQWWCQPSVGWVHRVCVGYSTGYPYPPYPYTPHPRCGAHPCYTLCACLVGFAFGCGSLRETAVRV
jgi:hypothetical protein